MKTTVAAVVAALLSFLIGNVWVFVGAGMFVQYFYEARMVALTHVFTLGWVSLMIVGVLRQLAPVAFRLNLKQPGLIGFSVVLWIPGLAAMIAGFATLRYTLAAARGFALRSSHSLACGYASCRWPPLHSTCSFNSFMGSFILGESR